MENICCIDLKNKTITKFDCKHSPTGLDRHEFEVGSNNKDEILAKAREALHGDIKNSDFAFCGCI